MKGSYDSECSFTFTNPYDSSDVFTADSNDCKGYQNNQVLATFYPPEYTITWTMDDDSVIDTTTVAYGATIHSRAGTTVQPPTRPTRCPQ